MGIIRRQGIKTTLVSYIGVIVGTAAVLFVYPLNDAFYGYAQWLYTLSYLLIPLASGGVLSLVIKYFPSFNDSQSENFNGFISLITIWLLGFYAIFLIFWFLFKPLFIQGLNALNLNGALIEQNEIVILLLVFLSIFVALFSNQSYNRLRVTVPTIITQLGFKIFLPLLILITLYYKLPQSYVAWGMIGFFFIANILLIIYLKFIGGLKFGKIKKPQDFVGYKEMAKFSFYGSMNQLSSSLAQKIDSIMIPLFLEMAKNGFYSKALFITNVIEMPTRSLTQIASPIISKAWKENDIEELSNVYKKASANLFVIGAFFFLVIWYILDDIIAISSNPAAFPSARIIFLWVASSKLVDMLTSVNSQIIVYSEKYRYNLFFLLFLAGLNIYLNFILIPVHGIVGAAMATAISLFIFNMMKLVFILFQFGLHPFTSSNIKVFTIFIIVLAFYFFIPFNFVPLINIIVKCIFLAILYLPIAYFWNISPDINELINNYLKKKK